MVGGDKDAAAANMAMLWILNLSDGCIRYSTLRNVPILPFAVIRKTAQLLQHHGLLTSCETAVDKLGEFRPVP